jgi:hypothetical protein
MGDEVVIRMMQRDIASGLGISKGCCSKLVARGMPTDSLAAARAWRAESLKYLLRDTPMKGHHCTSAYQKKGYKPARFSKEEQRSKQIAYNRSIRRRKKQSLEAFDQAAHFVSTIIHEHSNHQ